jgi:hypothetical protein
MRETILNKEVVEQIEHAKARLVDQEATVDALNALTNLDWVVNAEPCTTLDGDPVVSFALCANGCTARGTVGFAGTDALVCPKCAVALAPKLREDDRQLDADVLL